MTDLLPHNTHDGAGLTLLTDQAHDYARQSKADNTLRAYRFDWVDFSA